MKNNNIRDFRVSHFYTQKQLSKVVGVSQQAVNKWEHGQQPSMLNCLRLAALFGVRVEDLFLT